MDEAAFARWLAGVRSLIRPQRDQAFEALALAEAGDMDDAFGCPGPAIKGSVSAAAAAAPSLLAATMAAAPEGTLPSRIGRGRVASFGCPHCGGDDVRPWGRASGKPRCRCAACRKTFNPLTGTPLAGLHCPG